MKKSIKLFVIISILSISLISAVIVFAVSYHYDERGRLSELKFDSGETITFSYDSQGNRTGIAFNHDAYTSHGVLSVLIDGKYRNETVRNYLATQILLARNLRAETHENEDGYSDISITADDWWATPADHRAFKKEIDSTQRLLNALDSQIASNSFARGESFNMVVFINRNMGFADMMTKIFIPQGLELTGFSHNGLSGIGNNFVSPTIPTSGSNYALVGWQGRTTNITGDIALFTLTFTVANNAPLGLTEPFTITLDNTPTNADGEELQVVFIPDGFDIEDEVIVIGGVIIKDAGSN